MVFPAIVSTGSQIAGLLNSALGLNTTSGLLSTDNMTRLRAEAAFKGKTAQDIIEWGKSYPDLFKSPEFAYYTNANPTVIDQINNIFSRQADLNTAQAAAFTSGSTIEEKAGYLAAFGYVLLVGLVLGFIVWRIFKRK